MVWTDYIGADAGIVGGKPRIKGTRLSVEFILELLAAGATEEYLIENYPGLSRAEILACVCYASHVTDRIRSFPLSA